MGFCYLYFNFFKETGRSVCPTVGFFYGHFLFVFLCFIRKKASFIGWVDRYIYFISDRFTKHFCISKISALSKSLFKAKIMKEKKANKEQ